MIQLLHVAFLYRRCHVSLLWTFYDRNQEHVLHRLAYMFSVGPMNSHNVAHQVTS